MSKKRTVKIAIGQFKVDQGDTAKNLERCAEFINEAAAQNADIICFPELVYNGYNLTSEQFQEQAEPVDGPFVQALKKLARDKNIYIIAGYAQSVDIPGRIYNSAIFISDKGDVIGNMSKVNAWGQEKLKFREGREFPVYDTPLGKIGIMICYDVEFPEPARIMALKGAEIVFIPAVWSIPAARRWDVDLAGNALFNLYFMAGANPVGDGACGTSKVVGPDGEVRAEASKTDDELLLCDADLDEIIKVRGRIPYLNDFKEDTFSMDAINKY